LAATPSQGIAEGATADRSNPEQEREALRALLSNPEQETEALRVLLEVPLEVLDCFIEKLENKRAAIVRNELEERKKLPGPLSIEKLSEFTNSRLRSLDSRIARYKKAKQLKQPGATEAPVQPTRAASEQPPIDGVSGNSAGRRAAINGFISKVAEETGRRITRKDIWTVAGYRNRTEFERFQRGDKRTTRSAASNFQRVLRMKPQDFIRSLDKKKTSK
jgi:hypothetical protein